LKISTITGIQQMLGATATLNYQKLNIKDYYYGIL